MSSVYPEAPVVKSVPPAFDEVLCVEKIVELRAAELKITKVTTGGRLIHVVGGTVQDIERVWDEVEAERVAMASISPADHTTATKFTEALTAVASHLDADTWYEALKVNRDVTTWADLKAAFTPEAQEL